MAWECAYLCALWNPCVHYDHRCDTETQSNQRWRQSACITNCSFSWSTMGGNSYRLSINYTNDLAVAYLVRKKTCKFGPQMSCVKCDIYLSYSLLSVYNCCLIAFGGHRQRGIKASGSSGIVQIYWPTLMTGWKAKLLKISIPSIQVVILLDLCRPTRWAGPCVGMPNKSQAILQ